MYEEFRCVHVTPSGRFVVGPGGVDDAIVAFTTEGQMKAVFPPPQGAVEDWRRVAAQAKTVAQAVPILTALCQRGVSHPADAGLVWVPEVPGTWRADRIPPHMSRRLFIHYGARLTGLRPVEESGGMWVAPDADVAAFGVPYVAAEMAVPEIGVYQSVWVLGLCGLNVRIAEVSWDDTEGCAALFEAVLAGNASVESYLVQLSLAGEHEVSLVQQAHAAMVMRESVRVAREAFAPKRRRIRPRLVNQCVSAVTERFRRSGVTYVSSVVDLTGGGDPGAAPMEKVNAAVAFRSSVICGRVDAEVSVSDEWMGEVAQALREKGLGSVVRFVDGDRIGLLVTHLPDVVAKCRVAFGVPAEVVVEEVVVEEGSVWWRVVPGA